MSLKVKKYTFNKKEETILQFINLSVIINLSVVFVLWFITLSRLRIYQEMRLVTIVQAHPWMGNLR